MAERNFDVFLAHSSVDKPLIRKLYGQLKARGLNPWLDEEEIPPGTSFQEELQRAIGQVKAAAICIGASSELGRWQVMELRAFISQCVERNIPIIPVLLPEIETIPESLLFLQQFHAVSFQKNIGEELALSRLEWGITGRKPVVQRNEKTAQSLKTVAKQPQVVVKPSLDARYADLERYLKNGQWKEADDETYRLMITEVGKEVGQRFEPDDLRNFPCEPLKEIDGLWVKYSGGKFGFSVQKEIYLDCGGIPDGKYYAEAWKSLCEANGWIARGRYVTVKFDMCLVSPLGHLPKVGFGFFCNVFGEINENGAKSAMEFSCLASRLVNCNL
jgi:hypothetical protein